MPHIISQFYVNDFLRWKVVFDEFVPIRKHYTSLGARVLMSQENPNKVTVLTEFADLDRAREMYASQDFKDAIERAGVIGTPVVSVWEEIDQLSG